MFNQLLVGAQETAGTFDSIGAAINVSEIVEYAGELLGQVWPLLAVAIGIPLAFYVMRRIKGVITG